eukprot:c29926_g1_i1 orf=414-1577(-)
MKILNWVRSKFTQNFSHDPGQQRRYGCCASVLCLDDLAFNELKGLSTVPKLAESTRINETHSRYSNTGRVILPDVVKSEVARAFSDAHPRLLRITNPHVGIESTKERNNLTEQNKFALDDLELGLLQLAELQEELQKIFCSQNVNGRKELKSSKETKLGKKSNEESTDTRADEKHQENTREKKAQADKRLYPLQEFLETPLQQPIVKKSKLLRSLSSLLSKNRLLDSQNNISDTQPAKLSKTIPMEKFSKHSDDVPALLTARGTKIGLANRSLHGSGLMNLVQVFRKKSCRRASSPSAQTIPADELNVIEEAFYLCADRILSKHDVISTSTSSVSDLSQNPNNELESFTFHEGPNEWELPNQDYVAVSTRSNEYWINTDDEYVVLEL